MGVATLNNAGISLMRGAVLINTDVSTLNYTLLALKHLYSSPPSNSPSKTQTKAQFMCKMSFSDVASVLTGILNFLGFLVWESMRSYSWPDKLCYHGIMSSDLKGFPTVRFHFRGGAKLALEKDSMFYQPRPDAFCMAVNPASINNRYVNFSLIGMMAQQFYNVGYDIGRKQKTFQRMDCEVLDDD
ncbi:hypothetical protein CUMW_237760 [Citrus unshiu]|uniref:Xylanase inhibitor C-terminal domain-containing protein n=1 Tax=Citrus unshiu TaxID=55188 RepID=A0A2H5QK33_CITUN|nr:hypothetical protein CUMW_237760 [Citrus unshiu]